MTPPSAVSLVSYISALSKLRPYYADEFVTLYHGDFADILPALREIGDRFDLILTDPPYSSGGMFRGDRNQDTGKKYVQKDVKTVRPDFTGDSRDQRSFERWQAEWMRQALRLSNPGACIASFIDWRQLPATIDATQMAGWVYRGIVPWDKTEACRPRKGWFRSQAEYLVLGSAGALSTDGDGICMPGVLRHRVDPREKKHITGKPVALLEDVIRVRSNFRRVLDLFAGSGTTLQAAKRLGRQAVGIELEEAYCEIAAKTLKNTEVGGSPYAEVSQSVKAA
ncbi:DNA-methyltransferase [Verrucomicrobiota bacterium sgz303538]